MVALRTRIILRFTLTDFSNSLKEQWHYRETIHTWRSEPDWKTYSSCSELYISIEYRHILILKMQISSANGDVSASEYMLTSKLYLQQHD